MPGSPLMKPLTQSRNLGVTGFTMVYHRSGLSLLSDLAYVRHLNWFLICNYPHLSYIPKSLSISVWLKKKLGENSMNMLDGHAEANTCHSTQPSEVHPHWGIVRLDNLRACVGNLSQELQLTWRNRAGQTMHRKWSWSTSLYCVRGWNELPT